MSASLPSVHIFQIFYSQETRAQLDPGFIPLDNSENPRPDWREYWPIRRYLLEQRIAEGEYYGFLSPIFKSKTQLSAATVREFLDAQGGEPDVVLFSPFFDQIAFFLNPWEQGVCVHPDARLAFQSSLELIAPGVAIDDLVCSSQESVYCNYFIAKGAFWKRWLEACERIFECAEQAATALGRALNASIDYYKSGAAPTKVFIIERVVSTLLATQSSWMCRAYNPMLLPQTVSPISALTNEVTALDALKIAYRHTGYAPYLAAFLNLRAHWLERLQAGGR